MARTSVIWPLGCPYVSFFGNGPNKTQNSDGVRGSKKTEHACSEVQWGAAWRNKGMDHCANPHERSARQDEISSQCLCMTAQLSAPRHARSGVVGSYQFLAWKVLNPLAPAKEGVPSSRALVLQERTTSPHTPVRSRLVLPSFSISLLSTRCKTPPVARRSRIRQQLRLQSTRPLVTHSFNTHKTEQNYIDTRPVARSFPGHNLEILSSLLPTGLLVLLKFYAILYQLSLLSPPVSTALQYTPAAARHQEISPVSQLCDTPCISVTTTLDVRHDKQQQTTITPCFWFMFRF